MTLVLVIVIDIISLAQPMSLPYILQLFCQLTLAFVNY